MKKLIVALVLTSSVCSAQTQAEMNQQAYANFQKVDRELNEVYQKILTQYRQDTAFIKNLKASQRIWIDFRNAELKMKYPDRKTELYGSIHPICRAAYLSELTRERIQRLETWLEGTEEGDVCAGSVIAR